VSLDVPVSISVTRVVLLVASNLNLLETPLRKVDIASSKIAVQRGVPEAESSGQSANLAAITRCRIPDNFNLPVILFISNSEVTVAGNFAVRLGNGSINVVRVQVAASLGVNETND
jgi:hypothetical protein